MSNKADHMIQRRSAYWLSLHFLPSLFLSHHLRVSTFRYNLRLLLLIFLLDLILVRNLHLPHLHDHFLRPYTQHLLLFPLCSRYERKLESVEARLGFDPVEEFEGERVEFDLLREEDGKVGAEGRESDDFRFCILSAEIEPRKGCLKLTGAQSQTGSSSSTHQITQSQCHVLAHTQRNAPSRVHIDIVDPARVALERLEACPVGRPEERDGAVYRSRDEVRGRREVQRGDGS